MCAKQELCHYNPFQTILAYWNADDATTTHPRLSEPIGMRMVPLQTLDAAHGAARFDIYTGGFCSCFGLIFSCCFLFLHFWNVNAFSMPLYNGIMSLGFHFTGAP